MVQLLRALYIGRLPRHDSIQYWSLCREESILELEHICHSDIMQSTSLGAHCLPPFLCFVLLWYTPRNLPYVQFANNGPTEFSHHEYFTRANMAVAPHRSTPHQDTGRIEVYKDGAVREAPHSYVMHITGLVHYRRYLTYNTLLLWSMEDNFIRKSWKYR